MNGIEYLLHIWENNMTQPVSGSMQVQVSGGSFSDDFIQGLKNLIEKIQNFVLSILRFFLPCFFGTQVSTQIIVSAESQPAQQIRSPWNENEEKEPDGFKEQGWGVRLDRPLSDSKNPFANHCWAVPPPQPPAAG